MHGVPAVCNCVGGCALTHSLTPSPPHHGLRMAAVAGWGWVHRTHSGEARRWEGGGRQYINEAKIHVPSANMLHCFIRLQLQTANSKVKLLRIARQLLCGINSQVWDLLLDVGPIVKVQTLQADPIPYTSTGNFILEFGISLHTHCLSSLKFTCR